MLSDEQIKLTIENLDADFEERKRMYKNAKSAIQDLCNHKEVREVLGGRECVTCGKCFPYDDKSNRLVKKEYVEKNYWDEALNVCEDFAIKSNLSSEDIIRAMREVRDKYNGR